MDLRWRLFGYVLGFALALVAAAAAWVGLALREDVAEEMEASTRLVNVMLAVSAAPESRAHELQVLLESGQLRHVAVFVERSSLEQGVTPAASGPLATLVDYLLEGRQIHERRIPMGSSTLVIRADARAEIHEVLRDGARIIVTLVVFSIGMAVLAWLAAHRALKPVRELEQGAGAYRSRRGPGQSAALSAQGICEHRRCHRTAFGRTGRIPGCPAEAGAAAARIAGNRTPGAGTGVAR